MTCRVSSVSKILLVCLFLSLVWLSLPRCSIADSVKLGAIRAVVNGVIITDDDVRRRASVAIKDASEKYTERELLARAEQIFAVVLDELIDRELLVQEAQKLIKDNPAVKEALDKELDAFMKDAVDRVGSITEFYQLAAKEGINPVEKKKELREDIMADALLKEFAYKKISVSPRAVRDYYLAHKEDFNQAKEVKVRQILVKAVSDPKDAEKKAREILQRAEAGEDFAELAKQFSQDSKASSDSLYEHQEVKQWIRDLKDVALTLEQGEISPIVRSPVGFHIFKAEAVKPAKTPTFAEVQDEIYNILFEEEAKRRKKEYIQSLKKKAVIKIMK